SRVEQNAYAVQSHHRAKAALDAGRYEFEIIPIEVNKVSYNEEGPGVTKNEFKTDAHIRPESNIEGLDMLSTVFKADGTVTAGTAAPLTDGAGFVVVMSGEKVKSLGVTPIARFVGFKAVGVDPKIMGIGPAYAIPEVLEQTGLSVEDMD